MGLFSKLFGGDIEAEKAAKDILSGLFGAQNLKDQDGPKNDKDEADKPAEQTASYSGDESDSGLSWYDKIPEEENQYNYNGPFTDYFENIFNTEFAAYRFEKQNIRDGWRFAYTFYSGAAKVIVVELYTGDSKKLKKKCAREGIPYLRFYYNHAGWWNTRSYVVERMRTVLK